MAQPVIEISGTGMALTVENVQNLLGNNTREAAFYLNGGIVPQMNGISDAIRYQADPTGTNLCNDAFTAALLANNALYLPPNIPGTTTQAVYRLADWSPPRPGCTVFSHGGFAFPGPYYGAMVKKHTSATNSIFNLASTTPSNSTTLSGFVIDGVNRSAHGIRQGADNLLFRDLVVAVCNDGFGGGHGQTARFYNTHAYECVIGYKNQIDSKFYGAGATGCRTFGIRWEGGASFNQFIGRIEWNGRGSGYSEGGNVSIMDARDNIIDATIDAGYLWGVRSIRGINNIVRGQLRRNGRSDGSDSCQIWLIGNDGFQFDGVWSSWVDDDGNPPTTPKYGVIIDGGSSSSNKDISLTGILKAGTVRSVEKRGLGSTRLYIRGTDDGLDEG